MTLRKFLVSEVGSWETITLQDRYGKEIETKPQPHYIDYKWYDYEVVFAKSVLFGHCIRIDYKMPSKFYKKIVDIIKNL